MPSPLAERFGLRVQVEDGFLVRSGSRAQYLLSAEPGFYKSIPAARALARRHVPMGLAKQAVERLLLREDVAVDVPMVEDAGVFERELTELGVRVLPREPELLTTGPEGSKAEPQ